MWQFTIILPVITIQIKRNKTATMPARKHKAKVANRLDRAMGYGLLLIVCIVWLFVLPRQFIAALIILAVVWGIRSQSRDEFRRRTAKLIEAKRQSGKTRMKRGKRKGFRDAELRRSGNGANFFNRRSFYF